MIGIFVGFTYIYLMCLIKIFNFYNGYKNPCIEQDFYYAFL